MNRYEFTPMSGSELLEQYNKFKENLCGPAPAHVEEESFDSSDSSDSSSSSIYTSQISEVDELVSQGGIEIIQNSTGMTKITMEQAESLLNKLGIGYTSRKLRGLDSEGLAKIVGNKIFARIHQPEMGARLQSLEQGGETDREAFHTACLAIGLYANSHLKENTAASKMVTAKKTRGLFFSKKRQVIVSRSNDSKINVIANRYFNEGAQNYVFMGVQVKRADQGEVVVAKLNKEHPERNHEALNYWQGLTQDISQSLEDGKMPIQSHKVQWMNEISTAKPQEIYYYIERFSKEGTLEDFLEVLMNTLFHKTPEERSAYLSAFRDLLYNLLINVGYMHETNKTVHRDLKPENLIFSSMSTKENPDSKALLMGDPEMCHTKYAISKSQDRATGRAGTPLYMPRPFHPESTRMKWEECLYQDRYSLGVILIQVAHTLSERAIDDYRSTQLGKRQGIGAEKRYNLSDKEQEKMVKFSELLVEAGNHLTGLRKGHTIDSSRVVDEEESNRILNDVAYHVGKYTF